GGRGRRPRRGAARLTGGGVLPQRRQPRAPGGAEGAAAPSALREAPRPRRRGLPHECPAAVRGDRMREPVPGGAIPGPELQPDGAQGVVRGRRGRPHRGPRWTAHAGAGADGGRLRERAARGGPQRAERHRAAHQLTQRRRGMRIFDPHIHMTSRTTSDYQAMAGAGIAAVVEPSFWLGQPRTHVGTFEDDFATLLGWERFRASQFGIRHFCTLSLNPKEANNPRVAQGVIDLLPRYLAKDGVVAVGEVGFDDMTPEEEKYFAVQLELAQRFDLPVLVHTPHRDKKRGTERSIALVREARFPEERVLIDHNNEETLPLVLASGCW